VSDTPPIRRTRLWDAPTRLFHWSLTALFGALWWTGKNGVLDWHRRAGYCLIALLLFRIAWGLVGGSTARFSRFVKSPRDVVRYVRYSMFNRTATAQTLGHNPLGGWSVLIMLALLITQTGLGLVSVDVDGIESGPFSYLVAFDTGRTAAYLHHLLFNGLLGIVALHILAVLFYLLHHRENLVWPMISGNRASCDEGTGMIAAPGARAAGVIVISGIIVWGILKIWGR
jgi:cytochrome b